MSAQDGSKMASHDSGTLPHVCVLLNTRDRHEMAESAVNSIMECGYPPERMKVIVVEETDTPKPMARAGVEYHAIPVRNLGFGHARNDALRLADSEIVAFVDDDCAVERDWLREIVSPLTADSSIVAVAGAVLVPQCGPIGQCENILGFPGGGMRYVHNAGGRTVSHNTFSTCNCALRKKAVDESGGFDESLRFGGEDDVLSRRMTAKGGIVFNPAARVRHKPRDNMGDVFRWFVRRGLARVAMTRSVSDSAGHVWGMVCTSQFLRLAVVIALCLALGLSVLRVVIALAMLYYLSMLWRFRWSRGYYPATGTFLMLPFVKAAMDLGMDFGMIAGCLSCGGKK